MKILPLAAAVLAFSAAAADANDFEPQIRAYLADHVMPWASDQVLIEAILAQNNANAGLDEDAIIALDTAWQAEVGSHETPTITPVLSNAAAEFLCAQVAEAGGAILEVFVMDMHGLNVAASDMTSDYWQGDEDKFSRTYMVGADAVFIDEVEFDESTQSYQAQVSITLSDPATHQPIGAMTVGLNAEALF